jgi:hypothetical protein
LIGGRSSPTRQHELNFTSGSSFGATLFLGGDIVIEPKTWLTPIRIAFFKRPNGEVVEVFEYALT